VYESASPSSEALTLTPETSEGTLVVPALVRASSVRCAILVSRAATVDSTSERDTDRFLVSNLAKKVRIIARYQTSFHDEDANQRGNGQGER